MSGRLRWMFWAAVLMVGVGAGAGIALVHRGQRLPVATLSAAPSPPFATWAAGRRPAPKFTLTDQNGRSFSLAGLRGRPVLVTFIDPICRNFCPLEAKRLSDAVRKLSPSVRPTIVAVSVNPWADSRANFRRDADKWRLVVQWRWGTGSYVELARVWRSYKVAVWARKITVPGLTVHEISHTAAVYLLDRAGYERALLLYPFQTTDVVNALRPIVSHR